jgi:hypothetical protein
MKRTIQKTDHQPKTSENLGSLPKIELEPSVLKLIYRLCRALAEEDITYCHWKSNNALDRSANGDNDLDLLIGRDDIQRFSEILYRLKFKGAEAPPKKRMPGVQDYFGYDCEADKFIHVHAHYQLILGHDMTKNYHLPIERPYLESAIQGDLFKLPEIAFETVVFVIRMILKHSTWDAILRREGKLKAAERQELADLLTQADKDRIHTILKQHFPYISQELFNNCIQALNHEGSIWMRVKTGHLLQSKLRANTRHPLIDDTLLKFWRRAILVIQRRLFKSSPKYCLESGGAMIAIVGGDGAGKSTAIEGLCDWLAKNFELTSLHMGKPPKSLPTFAARSIRKIGNLLGLYPRLASFQETLNQKSLVSPGYPWLLRGASLARDRYWTYINARRFANNGGLVILDRFPVPQIQIMDGPMSEQFVNQLMDRSQADLFMSPNRDNPLTRFLINLEQNYYNQILPPDLLIVLRVDPEIAVQRKTDENPISVRERSTEIWKVDWENTDTHLIDASQSKTEVLNHLKALIWSEL